MGAFQRAPDTILPTRPRLQVVLVDFWREVSFCDLLQEYL